MQNEKDYFYHYNELVHIQDLETVFQKTVYAFLVFVILDDIVHLFDIDYYNFTLSVFLFDWL